MKTLNKHVYEFDELVIGNSLEAVSYSFLNQVPIIINDNSKIKFFDFFKPEDDLKKYKINQERYELYTNRGSLIVGSSKIEAWQKIVFSLSLSGLLPMNNLVSSVRVEDDNNLKVMTKNSRVIRFKFNSLRIFDDQNVDGLGVPEIKERFKVVDWVNVRAGMKHEYDKFETDDDFVNEVYFYPSQRVSGDDKKDLVAVSYLDKDQLGDFDFSDTYVKFKVKQLMKDNGIKGPKNGKRWDDPTKWAYHSIKLEPSKRDIIRLTKPVYNNEGNIIFDNRNERQVYRNIKNAKKGYLNKIYDSLL